MKVVKLELQERSYPIIITKDDFKNLAGRLKALALGNQAFIISNPIISRLYGPGLKTALSNVGINSVIYNIKDSESSKSIAQYIKTISKISSIDTKKRLFCVALGGGVVGDLTGFVAATYKRGIPYIQVPTTLLAQVDSAIGGKTAIDLASGKNLVGAFFQPKLVYSNVSLLGSLPARQISSGLAEVVKYGMIIDKDLFAFLEKNYQKILNSDKESLIRIISTASKIKAHIVANDEKETKGLRTILNFGHTIGHALETATDYTNLNHGEAISIGMVAACQIAQEIGILEPKVEQRLIDLLVKFNLPIKAKKVDLKKVYQAFYRDKKFINGKIRMVVPSRIGHVIVTEDIPFKIIQKIIKRSIS
ncbi:MAG: 3-dehydroquinate synthase [Candidatus Omnitrophica bacterium]|nr:3-dehydroquinate synthase [Candidatus Omnitrophota bacterium]